MERLMAKAIEVLNRRGFKGSTKKPIEHILIGQSSFPYGLAYLNVDDKRVNWLSREEATKLYDALGELLGKEATPEPKNVKTYYAVGDNGNRYPSMEGAAAHAERSARASGNNGNIVIYEEKVRPVRRYRMVAAEPTLVVEDLE